MVEMAIVTIDKHFSTIAIAIVKYLPNLASSKKQLRKLMNVRIPLKLVNVVGANFNSYAGATTWH